MTKRTKHVKTVEDIDAAIARWERRFKMAVGKIDRLRTERKRLIAKSAKPASVETPKAERVFPEKPAPETPTLAGTLERIAKSDPAGDLDIPGFLRRMPPDQAALRAAQAEAKKAKAVGAAARRKSLAKERAALGAIPKSKRRWDVNKSQWVAD